MIAVFAMALALQQDVVRGVVVDAASGAPLVAAQIATRTSAATTGSDGGFAIRASIGDTLRVRRIGFQATHHVLSTNAVVVHMHPAASTLRPVRVRDSVVLGHLSASRSVSQLREQGVSTTGTAIASMPFVSARSARGETTISLRGGRPEQVLVTIDGMPLNDPATGRADISDIPLAALGGVTVAGGAQGSGYGSGASAGVVTLTSGDDNVATISTSSLGGIAAEAALVTSSNSARMRIGAAVATSPNDFEFLNDAGTSDSVERRVNADERRAAVFASAIYGFAQATALYSVRERGLGGAKNVRAFDHSRETSERRMARVRMGNDTWLGSVGVRRLALSYRDEIRAELATEAAGTTVDADVQTSFRRVVLRGGVAQEHVWGTRLAEADRPSAFASASITPRTRGVLTKLDLRVDAVRGAGTRLSPTIAVERQGRVQPFAHLAQGFRLPTFYDLYAPSPMGFINTGIAPERVMLDAEAGVRVSAPNARASASLFERRTRDAVIWFPGNFSWSPKNVSSERVRGAEAEVSLTLGRVTSDWWGAWYDTRLYTDGLAVPTPYVPSIAGGASTRARFGRLIVATQATARGRRPFAVAVPSRALELPGVLLADVTLSYRVPTRGAQALLTAGVLNVANTPSESVRRFPLPGRVWQVGVTVHQ